MNHDPYYITVATVYALLFVVINVQESWGDITKVPGAHLFIGKHHKSSALLPIMTGLGLGVVLPVLVLARWVPDLRLCRFLVFIGFILQVFVVGCVSYVRLLKDTEPQPSSTESIQTGPPD
jgi:hypothetical protein